MRAAGIDYEHNLVACRMREGKPMALSVCIVRQKDTLRHPDCAKCYLGGIVMTNYKADLKAAAKKQRAALDNEGSSGAGAVQDAGPGRGKNKDQICEQCGAEPVYAKGLGRKCYQKDIRNRRRAVKSPSIRQTPAKPAAAIKPAPKPAGPRVLPITITATISIDADRLDKAIDTILGWLTRLMAVEAEGGSHAGL